MKKRLLAFVAGIISIGILTGCGGSKSINLTDYATVNFEGVDSQGTANVNYDLAQLEKDFVGDDDNIISEKEAEKLLEFAEFEFSIKWELDKNDALSNGDKVKVNITYNEDLAKSQKIKIKGKTSKEFKVAGLKEPIELDAFDPSVFNIENGIQLIYGNASPLATLSIVNNCADSQPQHLVSYNADKMTDISNGDTLIITASLSDNAVAEGYVLKEAETQITVSGLQSYVSKLSELNTDDRMNIEMQLKNLFDDRTNNWISFLAEGQDISLSPDMGCSYGDINFLDEESKFYKNGATIIPFNTDINNAEFHWWGDDYYEEPVVKSFNGVYGYFVVYNLKTTATGEISNEEVNFDIGALYDNKEQMDRDIRELFGYE